MIGNEVTVGVHEVRLRVLDSDAETKLTVGGATLILSPASAVANQSLSVQGRGFGRLSTINGYRTGTTPDTSSVSIAGSSDGLKETIGAPSPRIDEGEPIRVDSGGNWSANIILPINSNSTTPGTHVFKVEDSGGRVGEATLTIPERTLTVDPPASRVGTTVTIAGTGFPANNSESPDGAPTVSIEYDGSARLSVIPDASGNFTATMQVPLNADIPSTNTVDAVFNVGPSGSQTPVTTTAVHEVPSGDIILSVSEAAPGDTVTVSGVGFKGYTSLSSLTIGTTDILPSPRPQTGITGEISASFLVPQLPEGTQNVKARVGNVESSVPLVIKYATAEPMMPGMMMNEAMAPAMAFAAAIAEDNLITVYHFDPATQSEAPNFGWTLYDARPLFMGGNNLDMVNPGGFYFVEVSENQMGVTIGGRTMDLYAGLNPIVW